MRITTEHLIIGEIAHAASGIISGQVPISTTLDLSEIEFFLGKLQNHVVTSSQYLSVPNCSNYH